MFKKFTERVTAKGSSVFGNVTSGTTTSGSEQAINQDESPLFAEEKEDERTSSKNSFSEKINSESVSTAASIAASSMMGFMRKASSVASVAVREGSAKAVMLKNKALDAADMDALQRKLSYALDRQTGEVNLSLLNFSYITDNIVAMGFPSMNSGANRVLLKDNPIDLVAMYLNDNHAEHYMVWNLSGKLFLFCLCIVEGNFVFESYFDL
jgi:tensin